MIGWLPGRNMVVEECGGVELLTLQWPGNRDQEKPQRGRGQGPPIDLKSWPQDPLPAGGLHLLMLGHRGGNPGRRLAPPNPITSPGVSYSR